MQVAQVVEHHTDNVKVVGANPSLRTLMVNVLRLIQGCVRITSLSRALGSASF